MAEAITIARPYARALFAEAQSRQLLEAWQPVLATLTCIVEALSAAQLLDNPNVDAAQLESLCAGVLSSVITVEPKIQESVANFLRLVIIEKRLSVLPNIAQLYHDMVMQASDQIEVTVSTPTPLTDQQRQNIKHALAERFKATVTLVPEIDESLIGGMVLASGNWVMDGSVKGKLTRLAESLI